MSDIPGSSTKKSKEQFGADDKKNRLLEQTPVSEPSLNIDEVRELANLVEEHGFTDFEFENERIKIRFRKNSAPQIVQAMQPLAHGGLTQPASPPAPAGSASNQSESAAMENVVAEDNLHKITSPIVGTYYSAPAPDKEPYVREGSVVTSETTVCIVEAMKLMNEIQAEVAGEVVKIYVENGQPVEYGQLLFGVKK